MQNTSYWGTNDIPGTWPVKQFWLGLSHLSGAWAFDDLTPPAYSDSIMWNVATTGTDCIISQSTALTFLPQQYNCQANATNLICQNRPSKKWCPSPWRMANPAVCYLQPPNMYVSDYNTALATCQALGGSLPSFHNDSDVIDLANQVRLIEFLQNQSLQSNAGIWIGLSNSTGSGWTWSDNTTFDWNNWDLDMEPQPNLPCAVASFSLPNYQWKAENCNSQTANSYVVICQKRNSPPPTSKHEVMHQLKCNDFSNWFLVCLSGWTQIDSKCYKLVLQGNLTGISTKNACAEAGGRLPGFDSYNHYQKFMNWT